MPRLRRYHSPQAAYFLHAPRHTRHFPSDDTAEPAAAQFVARMAV